MWQIDVPITITARLGHATLPIAAILRLMPDATRARVGVCLDTCHLLASGYDICNEQGYRDTFSRFDEVIGFDRLKVFHLNDSKKPCSSRVDRHEHIGRGCIGLEPFRRLVNDPRFDHLPMVIETEKTETRGKLRIVPDPLDVMNLETLRGLRCDQRSG